MKKYRIRPILGCCGDQYYAIDKKVFFCWIYAGQVFDSLAKAKLGINHLQSETVYSTNKSVTGEP
jgi:hypothetical protein